MCEVQSLFQFSFLILNINLCKLKFLLMFEVAIAFHESSFHSKLLLNFHLHSFQRLGPPNPSVPGQSVPHPVIPRLLVFTVHRGVLAVGVPPTASSSLPYRTVCSFRNVVVTIPCGEFHPLDGPTR